MKNQLEIQKSDYVGLYYCIQHSLQTEGNIRGGSFLIFDLVIFNCVSCLKRVNRRAEENFGSEIGTAGIQKY